ncbi:Putative E3 ubiquitin-protein ligase ARI6 [Durusdinium trenchii]|uniref:E3 ubiquitin-protein ligase ARI6 n=1 Tax=Durusdinium trenchii TaxID=1381693 RepID=A0ABP0I2H6_9DINO
MLLLHDCWWMTVDDPFSGGQWQRRRRTSDFGSSVVESLSCHRCSTAGHLSSIQSEENTSWGSFMGEEVISFQPFYDLRTRVISLTSVVRDFFAKLQEALQTEQFTPT